MAKKTPLVSSRYAAMYVPNTTGWDFFDAFGKSDQCQAAFADSELSTAKKNVNKYLAKTANERLRLYRESQKSDVPQPPQHILELLKLQSSTGKFDNLDQVLSCLFMPPDIKFRHDDMFVTWEKATAFAVAAMRQQNRYFDVLCESHDKAFGWMESNEILFEARELLNTYQFSTVGMEETKEFGSEYSPSQSEHTSNDLEYMTESHSTQFSHSSIQDPVYPGSGPMLQNYSDSGANMSLTAPSNAVKLISTADLVQSYNGLLQTIDELNDDASAASFDKPDDTLSDTDDIPTRPTTPSFNALQERLHELSANRDEVKIAAQQEVVNRLQLEVITQSIRIEKLVEEVHVVADRCIKLYHQSDTTVVRCKQFDELTCMLGEGKAPTKGFTDWKEHGVVGVRPIMINFFLTVQTLAEERLTLQELESPEGRKLTDKIRVEQNLGRWKFLWNGHDVVHKVVHCLDFLRKCRELSEWYGPSFYFVANPLMLPFPLHLVYENKSINMVQKVYDQQMTVPHLRLGNMNTAQKSEWQHQQYLNQWRREFQAAAECCAFNWPTVPDIRLEIDNERLYTCLLVIYTTCAATLQKSYLWEKKLISQIHTVRGRDKLLIGENTAKVDKKLDIPSAMARTRKQSTMGDSAITKTNNRKSSTGSFAAYGYYSVASSQTKSSGLLDFSQDDDGDNKSQGSAGPALRPHLAEALKFTKTLQTAEAKAAQRAEKIREQLAALRKVSVMGGGGSPQGRRGTNLGGKSRSPSVAIGGRRTSSRPSVSAGGGMGRPSNVSPSNPSTAGNNNSGSPSRHNSVMRKSSSASAAGMGVGAGVGAGAGVGGNESAQNRRESNLRKSSTSPGLRVDTLRKGSTSATPSFPASPVSPVRSDSMGNISGLSGHTGKFKPSFGTPSDTKLGRHHTILEEENSASGSNSLQDSLPGSPKQLLKARQRSASKVGVSSSTKSAPGADRDKTSATESSAAGKPLSRSASRLSVGGSVKSNAPVNNAPVPAESGASSKSTGDRKLSSAPPLANRANSVVSLKLPAAINTNLTATGANASSKSMRFTQTAPSLAEASESSDSFGNNASPAPITEAPRHEESPNTKRKKSRKKSTVSGIRSSLAETSIDNTTVSLALASPPGSPGTAPVGHVKKKRGTIMAGEKGQQPRVSSIVTRLPPVQGTIRLTRRKGE